MTKLKRMISRTALTLACLGMFIPRGALAGEIPLSPDLTVPTVTDIALAEGGALVGQVVDTAGQPQSGQKFEIRSGDEIARRGTTDKRGLFKVLGLRGGVYHVVAAQGSGTIRAWSFGTAPPAAKQQLLVVDGGQTVRGLGQNLPNPWILAFVAAAAIGIPLALDDEGNAS